MTSVSQSSNTTLLSQWFQFSGGPGVDLLTTPTVSIVRLADGTTILPATTTGVSHPSTGIYTYVWSVSPIADIGDYLVVWNGTDAGTSAPVSASETVSVIGGASVAETWATPAEASSIVGQTITQAQLNMAYHLIETVAGVVTAARANLSNRDVRNLKRAESYQAAWMAAQVDLMGRSDADLVSQDGLQYSKGASDMHWLGPLAKAALMKLSWMRTRSLDPLTPAQALALRNKVTAETYGMYNGDYEHFLGDGGKWVPM